MPRQGFWRMILPREGGHIFAVRIFPGLRKHLSLVILVLVSVAWHVLFAANASPNIFPDTGSYVLLAEALVKGEWPDPGFAFRTPGYPAFLLLIFTCFGWKNWYAVMWIQYALAASIPVLLYFLFLPLARRPALAAVGAGAYFLDRYSLALPTVPLTEFLSAFTVLLALTVFVYGFRSLRLRAAVLAGVVAAVCVLVRPSFQLLFYAMPVLIGGLTVCYSDLREKWKTVAQWSLIFLLAFQLPLWAWAWNVYRHIGVFALSVQLGASMTNHTGAFMEDAPDEFAKIRDIYVAERNARNGNHINLFDQSAWKICEATGLTKWQLSLKFHEINKFLLPRHLTRYLEQVRQAWVRMWTEDSRYITDWTDPDGSGTGRFEATRLFRFIVEQRALRMVYWPIEKFLWNNRILLLAIPYLLLGLSAYLFVRRRSEPLGVLVAVVIPLAVLYHVLVHIAVQFTEFGRYRLPVQPIWFSFLGFGVLCAISDMWLWARDLFGKNTVSDAGLKGATDMPKNHSRAKSRRGNRTRKR